MDGEETGMGTFKITIEHQNPAGVVRVVIHLFRPAVRC